MKRRSRMLTAFASLLLVAILASPAHALDEADRLWLVGERAMADGLHVLARRTLERFVERHPQDRRLADAMLLLGRARLALGDAHSALDAFRRAQTFQPAPGRPFETRFWEAEALFRLRRFPEARTAYDTVVSGDATSPLAPHALYGFGWTQQELGQPEAAAKAFGDLIQAWPDHELAPSATFYRARALVDLKRFPEALPLLDGFTRKQSGHKLIADAKYLLAWTRLQTGDHRGGLADLRAFVAAYPQHAETPTARRLMTQTMARHGDSNEQLEVYKVLMTESPVTPEALSEAALIAGRLGRSREQEAAWRKLRAEFADHALGQRAALDLASGAYKRKDWKEVLGHAAAASKSDDEPVRVEAWLLTGEAELKLKHFPAAEKAFTAVVKVKDAEPGVRYRALAGLGLAHEEQREWRQALSAYQSVAGKSPDATLREWAKERVRAVKARMTPPAQKPKTGS